MASAAFATVPGQSAAFGFDRAGALLDAGDLAKIPALAGSAADGGVEPGTVEALQPGPFARICGLTVEGAAGGSLRTTIHTGASSVVTLDQTVASFGLSRGTSKKGAASADERLRAAVEICPPSSTIGRLPVDTAVEQPKLKKVGSSVPIAYRAETELTNSAGTRSAIDVVQLYVTEGALGSHTLIIAGPADALTDADLQDLAAATSKKLRAADKKAAKAEKKAAKAEKTSKS